MSIVYMCPTGTHSSLLTANIHLNKINLNSNSKDIMNLPYYGQYFHKPGLFFFIGKDEQCRNIYTLGVENEARLIQKSAEDFLKIFNKEKRVLFFDVSKHMPNQLVWCNAVFLKKGLLFTPEKIADKLKQSIPLLYSEVQIIKKSKGQELV